MVKHFNSGRAVFFLMVFICVIIAAAVLKIAATILLPLTIAFLLAILLIVAIVVFGLSIIGMVLFKSGSSILSIYPKYEKRLTEMYIQIARVFELPYNEYLSFWENLWGQLGIRAWIRSFAFSFSNIFLHFMATAVLAVVFVIFILTEASHFREKLDTAFEERAARINQMGRDIISQVTRYLAAKFFISLGFGLITAVGLSLIGLEFAILWGVIGFVLNFIPTLGSIVGGVSTCLFALIQFWPNPVPVIMVIAFTLISNMVIGYFFDPRIIGAHVGISPLMVLVSLGIWGYIWGFAGMILAVPMTVIIKIVCENIPYLEPVSILMGTRKAVRIKMAEQDKTEN